MLYIPVDSVDSAQSFLPRAATLMVRCNESEDYEVSLTLNLIILHLQGYISAASHGEDSRAAVYLKSAQKHAAYLNPGFLALLQQDEVLH